MKLGVGAVAAAVLLTCGACGSSQPGFGGTTTGPTHVTSTTSPWSPPAGCPKVQSNSSHVLIDYVDFVRWHGLNYYSSFGGDRGAPPLAASSVGPELFRIACELSAYNHKTYADPGSNIDRSAAFIGVGTAVHAVNGFPTSCRIAVKVDGAWRVYRAEVAGAATLTEASCPATTS